LIIVAGGLTSLGGWKLGRLRTYGGVILCVLSGLLICLFIYQLIHIYSYYSYFPTRGIVLYFPIIICTLIFLGNLRATLLIQKVKRYPKWCIDLFLAHQP
jgi:hypothetical protein